MASHTKMDVEPSGCLVSSSVRTRCSFSWLHPWIIMLNPWTSKHCILSSVIFKVDYYNRAHSFPIPSLAPVTRIHGCSPLGPGVLYRWITEGERVSTICGEWCTGVDDRGCIFSSSFWLRAERFSDAFASVWSGFRL